jgi:hypothetical protein
MAQWELARNVSPRMKRFREVNERLAEVATQFIEVETHTEKVDFTCECGAECAEPITMTLIEYEAIRAEPTHFGVIPGHEQPEIESVIRRFPNYLMSRAKLWRRRRARIPRSGLGRRLSLRPLDDPARLPPERSTSFGRDDAGELYAVALGGSL